MTCLSLVSANVIGRAQGIRFSQATFSPLAVGGRATTPVIADVNADGHADVVVALESDHAIAVLLGRSQGGFEPAKGSPFPAGNLPFSIALADLDVDGRLDVVAVNRTDNQLSVLRGDGLGGFRATANPIPTGQEPRTVRIANFNRDGKLDLAVANYGGASVSILLGNGSGDFTPAAGSPVPTGPDPWGLTVSDFNGDGAPDFAAAKRGDHSVSVLLNYGDARFSVASLPVLVGSQPFDITSADLNHDGKVDLVTTDTWLHTVTVLLGEGSGKVTRPIDGTASVQGGYPRMVVATDLNGDDHLDLVTANENSSISLLAGNGRGNFAPVAGSPIEQPGIMNTVAVGDLNGDGAPDIVGCGPEFGLTIWLNITNPAFEIVAPAASEADLLSKITLRRTHNLNRRLSFLLTTRDDTAQAGRDYTSTRVRVTFEPNQAEAVVNIPLTNDDFGRGARQFFVEVSDPDPMVVLPGPASVQVQDDDGLVTIRMEVLGEGLQNELLSWPQFFPEGGGTIRFTARRNGALNSTRRFHVHYQIEGRSISGYAAATLGEHFVVTAAKGDLEFGPGVTEQSVEIVIPDNTEAQGNRGMACKFTYDGLARTGSEETLVIIGDDERFLLQQQVVLEPYLPFSILDVVNSLRMPHAFHELPDGKVLVVLANTLLRLTREGLPDPSFGLGTGQAVLPGSFSPTDPIALDRVLGDGRLQLWQSGKLVRLTTDGVPDLNFGGGTGKLAIPGQLLDTATDGEMIFTDDGSHLKRLLPSGSTDPEFSSDWPVPDGILSCRISPQGRIWVITGASEAILFDDNGEPKPAAVRHTGVDFFPGIVPNRAFFDTEDRAYFLMMDSEAFGDPNQGRIIRYLANGSYDDSYRPLAPETPASILDMNPDGSALVLINGNELIQVDSTGGSRPVHTSNLDNISRAKRRSDGSILLSSVSCFDGGFWIPFRCTESIIGILGNSATFTPLQGTLVRQPTEGFLPWYRGSVEAGVQILRTDTQLGSSRVGLAHSGRFVLESAVSVSIQRAGSTAKEATVRGRIFPSMAGQWDASTAQPFEIEFRMGQTDVELTLPNQSKAGRQPLREYLVRLETATGVELSDFTACRLWVLDDDAILNVGELTLERFVGADERSSALLLGRWPTGKAYQHEYRWDPQIPWQTWSPGEGFPTLGPGWVKPVPIDGPGSGFFRMRSN